MYNGHYQKNRIPLFFYNNNNYVNSFRYNQEVEYLYKIADAIL